MIGRRAFSGLQSRLLLSYLLVVAAGIGAAALATQLLAPRFLDRMLERHQWSGNGMGSGMSASMHSDTIVLAEDALFQALLVATVVGTVAAVAASLFVARRINAPVVAMSRVSRRIASADHAARVPPGAPGELGQLGADLNALAAALQHSEQRRAELIAGVAHEIRTPLATVSGYLEGLADGVVAPAPALWTQLLDETARLNRLVDDLQQLSQLESGGALVHPAAVRFQDLVDAAVARLERAYEAAGVELEVEEAGPLPPVWADADRVVQVLTNLLTNALRYSEPGGLVAVSLRREGDALWCSVRDTGVGIASEHLPRVFDRFYRVDPARSRASGGSGIGLTIARAIVDAHGGQIRAESPGPGRGSTFSFTLPLAPGS